MENILAMVEGPGTAEITGFLQIDHTLFQELLCKKFCLGLFKNIEKGIHEQG